MRSAHFLFSKWRQAANATGNFCFAKSSHGSNAVGRCVARHHRCRKFCFAEVSPAGGEISSPASLFANFFSAPTSCREKVAMAFVHFLFQLPFVYNLRRPIWKSASGCALAGICALLHLASIFKSYSFARVKRYSD